MDEVLSAFEMRTCWLLLCIES